MFLMGLFIGVVLGVFIVALMAAARDDQ